MLSHRALSWHLPPSLFMLWLMPYSFIAALYSELVYCTPLSLLSRIQDNSDYTEENTMPKFLFYTWKNAIISKFFGIVLYESINLINLPCKWYRSLLNIPVWRANNCINITFTNIVAILSYITFFTEGFKPSDSAFKQYQYPSWSTSFYLMLQV